RATLRQSELPGEILVLLVKYIVRSLGHIERLLRMLAQEEHTIGAYRKFHLGKAPKSRRHTLSASMRRNVADAQLLLTVGPNDDGVNLENRNLKRDFPHPGNLQKWSSFDQLGLELGHTPRNHAIRQRHPLRHRRSGYRNDRRRPRASYEQAQQGQDAA